MEAVLYSALAPSLLQGVEAARKKTYKPVCRIFRYFELFASFVHDAVNYSKSSSSCCLYIQLFLLYDKDRSLYLFLLTSESKRMVSHTTLVTAVLLFIAAGQLTAAQVKNAVACANCCTQLNEGFDNGKGTDENVFNVFTCQTQGCVIGNNCAQNEDAFDRNGCEVGQGFLERGFATMPDADEVDTRSKFFCSVGGELSNVEYTDSSHIQLLNNDSQCVNCCRQLNGQFDFDTNDGYSVQACTERCRGFTNIPGNRAEIDVFDESTGECVKDPADNINNKPQDFFFNGCVIGSEMLAQGYVDFKGIRHFCQTDRSAGGVRTVLESVGAVIATVTNDDTVGGALNDCATCCDGLDVELDEVGDGGVYSVEACKEDGCHANQFCELLVGTDLNGCRIGKSFLTTGKVEFAGQEVLCQKGGVVTGAIVDVNQVLLVVDDGNDAELVGTGVGATLAVVAFVALAALYAVRRNARLEASKNVMTPQPRDYAFSQDTHNGQEGTYYGAGNYAMRP